MLPQEQLSTTLPRVELGQSIMEKEPTITVGSSVHPIQNDEVSLERLQ
jgi:hypothetical protein